MRLLLLIFAMLVGQGLPATARPISYPGGWMVMQENDGFSNAIQMQYSPTANYSIGYEGQYWRKNQWQFHGLALNSLLYRANNKDLQANLYLRSAGGVAYSDLGVFDGKTEIAGFTGVAADWENRRFFASYDNHLMYAGDIDKEYHEKVRVGVAPYIGEYGDLHTWLMLQVDHNPSDRHEYTVTPLIRLFKGTTLAEAGISNHSTILINFIHTF